MKKVYIFLIIGIIALGIGVSVYWFKSNKKISDNKDKYYFEYNSTRVSTQNETGNSSSNTITENTSSNNSTNNTNDTKNDSSSSNSNPEPTPDSKSQENSTPKETVLSEYSTKIYSKDPERQNNVTITCSTLNDTTVENGETFSFTSTIGKATSSKGYQKADVFKDGEKVQALGGGNCQVSSTLYNAVLKVDSLKVTERHEHSNSVPYVPKGKDAAVAYGSYDFKFVNNTGSTIKIQSSCDKKNVYVKILKLD